jgi:VanZ family protein
VSSTVAPRSRSQLLLGYWMPAAAYVALIYTLSSQPNLRPPLEFSFGDKLAHVFEYMVLGLLLARALRATLKLRYALRAALLAIGIAAAVGLADEVLQSFVPGRDASGFDWMADLTGATLAQLLYLWFAKD